MTTSSASDPRCIPEFDRLNYYYGQMLGPRDFQTEQDFFRHKMKMLNRCLHGYGVVCGLEVKAYEHDAAAVQKVEAVPVGHHLKHMHICIAPGLALDPEGNELVVRENSHHAHVDLWATLCQYEDEENCKSQCKKDDGLTLWVSLQYHEHHHKPERVSATCADSCSNYESFARIRESACVKVSLAPPEADQRCGTCCSDQTLDSSVLLARIDNAFSTTREPVIHNEIRRPVGLYQATTITGINWLHGATYDKADTERFLRKRGLTIHFSRPVLSGTIKEGVIDVWTTDDWQSPKSSGEFKCKPVSIQPIPGKTTTEVTFKIDEDLDSDDRVLIIVRCDFILDTCCRPVDGNHVGGKVPLVGEHGLKPIHTDNVPVLEGHCQASHRPFRRHESGNGTPGGTFESWFFTGRRDDEQYA